MHPQRQSLKQGKIRLKYRIQKCDQNQKHKGKLKLERGYFYPLFYCNKLLPIYILLLLTKKQTLKPTTMSNKLESIKVDKGIHREIMIEMGMYNIHKHKVYKDKKQYTRKAKHKKDWN